MFARRAVAVASRLASRARALHVEASKASIAAAIEQEKVLIFSKTTCPYCARVKGTLDVLDAPYEAVDLNTRDDGAEIQALLLEMTGQRTVPNVFIKGKHIGGCDAVMALHAKSELVPMLQD